MTTRTTIYARWISLTDLGKLYGMGQFEFGQLLKEKGFRLADGKPSCWAYDEYLVTDINVLSGQVMYSWNRDAMIDILAESDLVPLDPREAKIRTFASEWIALSRHCCYPHFEKNYLYEKLSLEVTAKIIRAKLIDDVEDMLTKGRFKGNLPSKFVDKIPVKKPRLVRR